MAAADPSALGTLAPALMSACIGAGVALSTLRKRAYTTPPAAARKPHTVRFGDDGKDVDGRPAKGTDRSKLMSPPRERIDDLFWLRSDDRSDEKVLDLVRHENEYTARMTARTQPLRDALYKEMLGRIQETDSSAPWLINGWYYYSRTTAGASYGVHCRKRAPHGAGNAGVASPSKPEDLSEEEQVVLNENALAAGKAHCDVGDWEPSPSGALLGYSVDYDGDESYTIHVRRLADGTELEDRLEGTMGEIVWGRDDSTLFYTTHDDEWRSDKVWRHVLGQAQEEDELLLSDTDPLFSVSVSLSRSQRLLVLESGSIETSEAWIVDLDDPAAMGGAAPDLASLMKCVEPRTPGLRYTVTHRGEGLLIVHNDGGDKKNGEIAVAPLASPSRDHWRAIVPYDDAVEIKYASAFQSYVLLKGRQAGSPQLWVLAGSAVDECAAAASPGAGGAAAAAGTAVPTPELLRVPSKDAVYSLGPGGNRDFGTTLLRVRYSSPLTPAQVLEVSVPEALAAAGCGVSREGGRVVKELTSAQAATLISLVKQANAPNVDTSAYSSRRVYCPVPRAEGCDPDDTVLVPISLVWRPDRHGGAGPTVDAIPAGVVPSSAAAATAASGASLKAPLLLYGYGSYGISIDPSFSSWVFSFLDRGGVYAVAHVRGGGEMGRGWYEDMGKFLTKKNTFEDFAKCAEFLTDAGWADKSRIAILGRSAGGLLVGRSVTMRPDLWTCAVADVPFVDLMSTMQDETIPLTTGEWEEWGNPNEAKFHDYMLQYSPMDTIPAKLRLPHVLLTAGLRDPRVQFWEPLKFAQRLRAASEEGSGNVLMKTDMSSGHFSASDRYRYIRELAFEVAFVLDCLDMA